MQITLTLTTASGTHTARLRPPPPYFFHDVAPGRGDARWAAGPPVRTLWCAVAALLAVACEHLLARALFPITEGSPRHAWGPVDPYTGCVLFPPAATRR